MPNHGIGSKRRRRIKQILLARDSQLCAECLQPFTAADPATIEHFIPRAHGGTNSRSNLQLLHEDCNQARARTMRGET